MKLIICVLLMLLMSTFFISSYSQNPDIYLLKHINHLDAGTGFNNTMLFITNSASVIEITGTLGMGLAGWKTGDQKLMGTAIVAGSSFIVNLIATTALKYSINRPRPMASYPDQIIDHGVWLTNSHSFPSGHTSAAFAFATSITLAYPVWYIALPAYLWASSVGFSRMYLGVHYPSDIAGGILVGAGSAYLTYRLNDWWNEKHSEDQIHAKALIAYQEFSDFSGR